jgi:hypothetical protein
MPEQISAVLAHFGAKEIGEVLGPGKLAVDYFDGPEDGPLILSPNIVDNDGKAFPVDPRGQCVFLQDGRCSIQEVKPFECREFFHTDSHEAVNVRHAEITMAWRGRKELEPYRQEIGDITFGDMLGLLQKSILDNMPTPPCVGNEETLQDGKLLKNKGVL